jgi:hypothetical protein
MMTRSTFQLAVFFIVALAAGAGGAQGCRMYNLHSDQHRQADDDHKLLLQMTPIVNQLLQIEQQRQQAR